MDFISFENYAFWEGGGVGCRCVCVLETGDDHEIGAVSYTDLVL